MTYKLIGDPIIQGGDLGLALNIRILTSDTGGALVDTLRQAVEDHNSTRYAAIRVRAYADREAVAYNGWQAEAVLAAVESDVFFNFDNDPDERKFLYEQGRE